MSIRKDFFKRYGIRSNFPRLFCTQIVVLGSARKCRLYFVEQWILYLLKHSVYPYSGVSQRPSAIHVLLWSPISTKSWLHSKVIFVPGVKRKLLFRPKRGVSSTPHEITVQIAKESVSAIPGTQNSNYIIDLGYTTAFFVSRLNINERILILERIFSKFFIQRNSVIVFTLIGIAAYFIRLLNILRPEKKKSKSTSFLSLFWQFFFPTIVFFAFLSTTWLVRKNFNEKRMK